MTMQDTEAGLSLYKALGSNPSTTEDKQKTLEADQSGRRSRNGKRESRKELRREGMVELT